jgi:hypothetical protein
MDERRRDTPGCAAWLARFAQQQVSRLRRDAGLLAQPAPSGYLVLVRAPQWPGEPSAVGPAEHDEAAGPERGDQAVAGRAAAVQVDRQVRRGTCPPDQGEFPRGQHLVDRPGERCEFGEHRRGGEHDAVAGKGAAHGPVGRHSGEEVTQAERPQQQDATGHGPASATAAACSLVVDRPSR